MKTPKEIVEETLKYYKSHKRAVCAVAESCFYFKGNKKCAVGRCMVDPKKFKNEDGNVYTIERKFGLESLLREEYKGHCTEFWKLLQSFHDNDHNWKEVEGKNELTSFGEKAYKDLLNSSWE